MQDAGLVLGVLSMALLWIQQLTSARWQLIDGVQLAKSTAARIMRHVNQLVSHVGLLQHIIMVKHCNVTCGMNVIAVPGDSKPVNSQAWRHCPDAYMV